MGKTTRQRSKSAGPAGSLCVQSWDDSITVFAIDPTKGTLTQIQVEPTQGKIPRNFAIDPTGKYLVAANQKSDQMVVFDVDQNDGQLKPAGQVVDAPSPVSILFVPAE